MLGARFLGIICGFNWKCECKPLSVGFLYTRVSSFVSILIVPLVMSNIEPLG